MKKALSAMTAAAVVITTMLSAAPAQAAQTSTGSVTDYTYTVTPLLGSFNTYFFVETDNPDPTSFRFTDYSTVYGDEGHITRTDTVYSDVSYEDAETLRVSGGYIFYSNYRDTDGGEITLQALQPKQYSWSSDTWEDTDVILTLPPLVDNADYLINTYGSEEGFFENMSAIQRGFSSICLYSGSYVRGEIIRTDEYWLAAAVGHVDQSLYIYSPFERKDSKSLFASAIYPYRYDSLGFPGMMGTISKRLDSSSSYKWNEKSHYLIDVTYNGETKSYGGAGNVEGKGISEDKITRYFTFGEGAEEITLDSARTLLVDYAKVKMEDDIPRDDELTWKQICDTVGEGAWVRVSGSSWKTNGRWNLNNPVYTYLYTKNNGTSFSDDEFGAGNKMYWGGDLGYFKDAWVDGRYINVMRRFIPGEKFEDHPTSNIYLTVTTVPQVKYKSTRVYNKETGKYEYVKEVTEITEKTQKALYRYNSEMNVWKADTSAFESGCANYSEISSLVSEGKLDSKYMDMVTLTPEQAQSLGVDRNTDVLPPSGYVFDGTLPCGTPFKNLLIGDIDGDGSIGITDATMLQRHLAEFDEDDEQPIVDEADPDSFATADMNQDGFINILDVTEIQRKVAGLT